METALSQYLESVFRDEFYACIPKPEGTKAGDRVVYKLKEGVDAVRSDMTPDEVEDQEQQLADKLGVDRSSITTAKATTSGSKHPRFLDLPGSHIIYDIPLIKYSESEDILPVPDFPIIWALGVVFGWSDKIFSHIDFVHPKVKGIFSAVYETEDALGYTPDNIIDWHNKFSESISTYKDSTDDNLEWVKVIHLNGKLSIQEKFKNKKPISHSALIQEAEQMTDDMSNAIKFRKEAEQGDAVSQNSLGIMYTMGTGVTEDIFEAKKWFHKAAEQGLVDAQTELGVIYIHELDYANAVKWFRMAAEQGDAYAQKKLGLMYEKGMGVPKDAVEAMSWFRKAAEQGNAYAQRTIEMYEKGIDPNDVVESKNWFRETVAQAEQGHVSDQINLGVIYLRNLDYTKAAKWFRKAAEQGNAYAQKKLGLMYEKGMGVPKDAVESMSWFRKAAAQGNRYATSALKDMCQRGLVSQEENANSSKTDRKIVENITNQFELTSDDRYAIAIAKKTICSLLKSSKIDFDKIIDLSKALSALERLPDVTPGASFEFGLTYRNGDQENEEIRTINFIISDKTFEISVSDSANNNASGQWIIGIDGFRKSDCDLHNLENEIARYLNRVSEITFDDDDEFYELTSSDIDLLRDQTTKK